MLERGVVEGGVDKAGEDFDEVEGDEPAVGGLVEDVDTQTRAFDSGVDNVEESHASNRVEEK